MMKNSKTLFRRILVLSLSLAVLFSAYLTSTMSAATTVSATDSHVVYSDDFEDADTLSDWRWVAVDNANYSQYTASIADGQMTFNNTNASGSFLHGMRFIPNLAYTEQRVEITFKAQKGLKPHLWARVNQTYKGNSQSCYGYYLQFNCNQNGNVTLDLAKRLGTTSSPIGSISYGTAITEGQEYRMEMVLQGTSPTLISVSLYTKVNTTNNAVVCHNIFTDSEAALQVPGSAGISAARTGAVAATDVSIDSFTFTSTDNVAGRYYVEEASASSKTFGQVVMLDPTKTYVLAAHAVDNGLNNNAEFVNPLWIEYFTTSNSGTRVLTARGSLKSNRLEEDVENTGIDYNEYFTVFYNEFDMSALSDAKVESGIDNKTRVLVGFRCDGNASTAGKFSHFTLYAADDPNKTNLLINPDFKMGLYGWNDAAGAYMNYTQMAESVGTATSGNVTFSDALNEYEYYDLFKNSGYAVLQGDANRDTVVDIRDLVFIKNITEGISKEYNVAIDYDLDGSVLTADLTYLRMQLLDVPFDSAIQLNVSANAVLNLQETSANVAVGSGYTADYQ